MNEGRPRRQNASHTAVSRVSGAVLARRHSSPLRVCVRPVAQLLQCWAFDTADPKYRGRAEYSRVPLRCRSHLPATQANPSTTLGGGNCANAYPAFQFRDARHRRCI